jgi:glycerol-3-phosphate dehydrogenase
MKERNETIEHLQDETFDVCIIGGGATGAGCALDSQLRGLRTLLLEAQDFVSSSSSASTKMAHGGVRYLQEAVNDLDVNQYHLVEAALRERAFMLQNAPFLTRKLEFLVPCFSHFEKFYYGLGMKMYDWISGKASLFPSRSLSRDEALHRMPAMQPEGLVGAVAYADGQFDDARYGITLLNTFRSVGGAALNYARVTALEKNQAGQLCGATAVIQPSGRELKIAARAFVNATGAVSDVLRQMASPSVAARMRPSKGVHILFPLDGFPDSDALLVPKTEDGRVIFAVPWNGRLLVGTTDTGYKPGEEMVVTREEVEYLLRQLNPYLHKPLAADQVVSGFAGIRPLVASKDVVETKKLIRDDEVEFDSESGLVSILGGKWTTHRLMGEETINKVQEFLDGHVTPSMTRDHPLLGSSGYGQDYWQTLVEGYRITSATANHLAHKYGTLSTEVLKLAEGDPNLLFPLLEGQTPIRAEVIYAARNEMAMTVEDVLARRIGLQLFGWRLAIQAAPTVASLLARELAWSTRQAQSELEKYVAKVNRMLEAAGQAHESVHLEEAALERSL